MQVERALLLQLLEVFLDPSDQLASFDPCSLIQRGPQGLRVSDQNMPMILSKQDVIQVEQKIYPKSKLRH